MRKRFGILSLFLLANLIGAALLFGAAAFVQHVEAGGTEHSVTTGAANMTSANLLVLCLAYSSGGTLSSVTDDSSNVYTALTAECGAEGTQCVNLYYKASPTVDNSMTFTASGTSIFPSIVAMGFSGMHATPLDQEAAGGYDTTAMTVKPGPITPSEANTLLVTCASFNVGTLTINSPYVNSVYQIAFSGGNHYGVAGTYFVQGAAAQVDPTWTNSDVAAQRAVQASFLAAAGTSAAPSAVPQLMN